MAHTFSKVVTMSRHVSGEAKAASEEYAAVNDASLPPPIAVVNDEYISVWSNRDAMFLLQDARVRLAHNEQVMPIGTTPFCSEESLSSCPKTPQRHTLHAAFSLCDEKWDRDGAFGYDHEVANFCRRLFELKIFETWIHAPSGRVLFDRIYDTKKMATFRIKDRKHRALIRDEKIETRSYVDQWTTSDVPDYLMKYDSDLLKGIRRVQNWNEAAHCLLGGDGTSRVWYVQRDPLHVSLPVVRIVNRDFPDERYLLHHKKRVSNNNDSLEHTSINLIKRRRPRRWNNVQPAATAAVAETTQDGGEKKDLQPPTMKTKESPPRAPLVTEMAVSNQRIRSFKSHMKYLPKLCNRYDGIGFTNLFKHLYVEREHKMSYVRAVMRSIRQYLRSTLTPLEIGCSKILSGLIEIDVWFLRRFIVKTLPAQLVERRSLLDEKIGVFEPVVMKGMRAVLCRYFSPGQPESVYRSESQYLAYLLFYLSVYTGARARCDLQKRLTREQLKTLFDRRRVTIVTKNQERARLTLPDEYILKSSTLDTILVRLGICRRSKDLNSNAALEPTHVDSGIRVFGSLTEHGLLASMDKLYDEAIQFISTCGTPEDKIQLASVRGKTPKAQTILPKWLHKKKRKPGGEDTDFGIGRHAGSTTAQHVIARSGETIAHNAKPENIGAGPIGEGKEREGGRIDTRTEITLSSSSVESPPLSLTHCESLAKNSKLYLSRPKGLSCHAFRRQYIGDACSSLDINFVAKLVNHKDVATTLRYKNSAYRNNAVTSGYVNRIFDTSPNFVFSQKNRSQTVLANKRTNYNRQ